MSDEDKKPEALVRRFREDLDRVRSEVGKMIVGQEEILDGVLTCLIAGGHALLEGVPGLGKTMLVRSVAEALHLQFSRVQFTPDLMPSDILGTTVIAEDDEGHKDFQFRPGPVFANIVLADEVNRATPKTQSALLEVMQEHSVTVGKQTHTLEQPYFVLATQNPLEMEGTYPLPEAQLDRFLFKLQVTIRILEGTHPDRDAAPDMVQRFVRFGASPRGAQACLLAAKIQALMDGRFAVGTDDVRAVAKPALRHRMILNFEGEAEGVKTDAILDRILETTKETSG